ncbi:MAG: type II secretion system protein N [Caulobacter sp.]|nr:type II secretion system protein N [Caulobacter sp.]
MTNRTLLLIFLVALLAALPLTTPLAVGLAAGKQLSFAKARGTIWRGEVRRAGLGPLTLGDLSVGLDPLALLTGQTKITIRAAGGDVKGAGRIALTRRSPGVEGFTGSLPLTALGLSGSLTGDLTAREVTAVFDDGACREAAGDIAAVVHGLGANPVALRGRPVCQGAVLALPLAGTAEGMALDLVVRLRADGRYSLEATVKTTDPAFGAMLAAEGFTSVPGGYSRTSEGKLA